MTAEEANGTYAEARARLLGSPGAPAAARRRALTALTDDWLHAIYVASGAGGIGAALVAVGGYGRGDLAPGSDLDLLLLHPASADPSQLTAVADRLWYPVWDAGLKLDHAVRAPAEARRLAAQDIKVLLGLLDARTVVGDEALTRQLRESVLGDWRALAPRRLDELRFGVEERIARSGELAHLLEPDIKDSYGGLRDLVALRAVAASWVTDAPVATLAAHRDLLLDVRDALHLVTSRPSDRLLHQEQAPVAALLELDGDDPADALLRAVSGAGRAVAYAADTTWHRVERLTRRTGVRNGIAGAARRLRSPRAERSPLAEGVVVQDGEAVLAADARPERDPVLVLRAAAAAAQTGLRLAPHAVERLARDSAELPVPWPAPARDAFVSLLGAGRPAVPVWEALDQSDIWSRLLPEWSVVRSAPQHNPIHRFTVDRHLVETAVQSAAHTRRVGRPDLLLVGALLHDIGKGRPGDHTDNGVALVAELAPRLGFPPEDVDVLVALVRHHLLLPETATRRDLDDPATVTAVATAVGDQDTLDLLHALTEADAAATGPAAWSDWKKSLVDELVARTRAVLAGRPRPADPRTTTAQRLLSEAVRATSRDGVAVLLLVGALLHDIGKGRPGDHTDNGVALVEELAPRLGFPPEDVDVLVALVRHHLLLPETATRRDLDDPATVTAVATAVGDQDTLDLLHALTEADAAATGPAAWSDWKKSLVDELVARTRAVLAGRPRPADPRTTTAQRLLSEAVRATSRDGVAVLLDEESTAGAITVTVAAPDRSGLLASVAGVLSLHRLQVRGAQVDTVTAPDGSRRAVQVWTVTPAYGDPPPEDRLREDVVRALAGSLDVAARLDAREQAYPAPQGTAAPRVAVVPGASERATVLEVRAHDAPALLHRITRAIAAADVMITAARVATLGSEAVDVFYLVDRDGAPLSDARAATAAVTVLGALSGA